MDLIKVDFTNSFIYFLWKSPNKNDINSIFEIFFVDKLLIIFFNFFLFNFFELY